MIDHIEGILTKFVGNNDKISRKKIQAHLENPVITTHDKKKIAKDIEKSLHIFKTEARFEVDLEEDILKIKIIDKENNEIIREIPSEEAVKRYHAMKRIMGLIFDMDI